MNIEVLTLCDHAQVMGDKLNVLGAFNFIETKGLPFSCSFCVALRFRYDTSEFVKKRIYFKFVDPDNKDHIDELMCEVEFSDNTNKFASINLIINIQNENFIKFGIHRLIVKAGDKTFESPLDIRQKR